MDEDDVDENGENNPQAPEIQLMLLLAVALPPMALNALGTVIDERSVETRYGTVGPLALRRTQEGARVWVQPYSGMPTRTDPRATLLAAKELGVQRVLNWDAAVAVNGILQRGESVIVADFIDFTRHQPQTYFEDKGPGALKQDPPVCPQMTGALLEVLGGPAGVYLGVDGPRRESAAEARMFRQWGADTVGQNMVPEISLAAELELCFAGLVTVEYRSADQHQLAAEGEMRQGLGSVLEALPDFLHLLTEPASCNCANRLSAARDRGLLAEGWWQV